MCSGLVAWFCVLMECRILLEEAALLCARKRAVRFVTWLTELGTQ